MIRDLVAGGRVVAKLVDAAGQGGAEPVSSPEAPLQVVRMQREKGYVVPKHGHARAERVTLARQKALVVISGSIDVVVCDESGVDGDSCTLIAGQCLYVIEGGYSLSFTEDSVFYEFKNGPHTDDKIAL